MRQHTFVFAIALAVIIERISAHSHSSNHNHTHDHDHSHHGRKPHNCTQDTDPDIQEFYRTYGERHQAQQEEQRLRVLQNNEFNNTSHTNPTRSQARRQLASPNQPLRVTFDTSKLYLGQLDVDQRDYIINLLTGVQTYLKNLINVVQTGTNNFFPSGTTSCVEYAVPAADKTSGIANSDLHVYVYHEYNYNNSYQVSGQWCNIYQSGSIIRPNFARFKINLNTFTQTHQGYNTYLYQSDLLLFLHEFIHILGFTYGSLVYWVNPSTGSMYGSTSSILEVNTIRGYSTSVLKSPYVLQAARIYYQCYTTTVLTGMQLENYGELLTAYTITTSSVLSPFTIAALKDTGFWNEVSENLSEDIYWGKGKGCNFWQYACNVGGFEEFSSTISCTFGYSAQSYSYSEGYMDGCYYNTAYSYFTCNNPYNRLDTYNNPIQSEYLDDYNNNSRCFYSTVQNPTSSSSLTRNTRCHSFQCSPDMKVIYITSAWIPSFIVTCGPNEASVIKNAYVGGTYIGQITCPQNYDSFCQPQRCKNYCTQNGVCVRGNCICNTGYSGDDCSLSCAVYSEAGVCVSACSTGYYVNPDNTCKLTCPDSYYPNGTVCTACHFSCSKCTGPNTTDCTACQLSTFLNNGSCGYCPAGYYGDYPTKKCAKCPAGCTNCYYGNNCYVCDTGYTLNTSTNLCEDSACTAPCNTCSDTPTMCTSCQSGFYLDASASLCVTSGNCPAKTFANGTNRECSSCSTGCSACTSALVCTQCDASNNYRLDGAECTLCAAECRTCVSGAYDTCTSCSISKFMYGTTCVNACPDGYYNGPNNKCTVCMTGCKTCITGQQCLDCDLTSYYPYTWNSLKLCIQSTTCFSPCATCTTPYFPEICQTCDTNFFLQGNDCLIECNDGYYPDEDDVCQECDMNCKTCHGTSTTCTSCNLPYGLYQGLCMTPCPPNTIIVSQECTPGYYTYNTQSTRIQGLAAMLLFVIMVIFVY